MLLHLRIRNLAIIDELDLEFGAGFTVLTGETGAGKSILIDAIGLAIGTRADATLVRSGREKAEIAAEFRLAPDSAALAWLREQELLDADDPQTCLLRRVLYAEGRTRAFVNNAPVSAAALRELGERLIEVFGQNQSQTLLRGDTQRQLLDAFGGHLPELQATAEQARRWQELSRQIERLRSAGSRDPAQLDYLRHQIRELEALALQPGELEQLDAEHRRLANAGRLLQDGGRALDLLYGGEASVYDQLSGVAQLLARLSGVDAQFSDVERSVAGMQAQLREAASQLQRLLEALDLEPEQLAQLEQRLADIHELARKHRLRAQELPQRLAALRSELDEAELAAGGVERLQAQLEQTEAAYRSAARQLGECRRAAAQRLAEAVTANVRQLGMPHAQLVIAVEAEPGREPRVHGDDAVRFDFSANPGQPLRPMAKVASGGELSRLSLAIQVAARQAGGGAATMIFDEVDAGIGGGVAEIVGQQLRALGAQRQVLCVTHLAQVAAQGRSHYGIRKQVRGDQTYTRLAALEGAARVEELARMMGGVEITASTQAHARELLERAGAPERLSAAPPWCP